MMFRFVLRAVIMVAATASAINQRRTDRRRNKDEEELESWKAEMKRMEDRMEENGKNAHHLQAHLHRVRLTLTALQRQKQAIETELSVFQENNQSMQLCIDRLARAKMDLLQQLSAARTTLLRMDRVREKLRRDCNQKEATLTELRNRVSAREGEIAALTDRFGA